MNAMQKLVIRRNAARRNGKKGFTLVELIIVIAILAALVAILAPQYTKYVEKSRVAADKSQLDSIVNAVKTCAVDPDTTAVPPINVTITTTAGGKGSATLAVTVGDGGTLGDFETNLRAALGLAAADKVSFKSKDMLGAKTITIALTSAGVTTSGVPDSLK